MSANGQSEMFNRIGQNTFDAVLEDNLQALLSAVNGTNRAWANYEAGKVNGMLKAGRYGGLIDWDSGLLLEEITEAWLRHHDGLEDVA